MAWWQNFDSPAAAWLRRIIMRHRDEGGLRSRPRITASPQAPKLPFDSETRLVTVLYSNMRDFVSLCERFKDKPEQVVEMLNAYFTETGEVVAKYNGTVDKYVGDCFSAVYNAPLERPDHPLEAVQTALELQERTQDFSRRWEARVGGAIRCGVGISTGYALVSTGRLRAYLATGAAVDLAARLESLTKEYEVPIVISETTHEHLAARITTRELGDVVVKGRAQPLKIFAVLT